MQAETARDSSVVIVHAVRRALRGYRVRLGLLRGLSLACAVSIHMPVAHAELPQICVSCANGTVNSFVGSGSATMVTAGNNMTVNQTSAHATLNWQSFNISSGNSVNFVQPDSSSIALNRIYQGSASQIMGNLTANGRVYLLNQNGIVFGNGAQVNVAGLIASSLDISPAALNADGSTNLLNAYQQESIAGPAFRLYDNLLASKDISIEKGATLSTTEDGQVFIFAPNIINEGTISTPGGQTVLAAGTSVYLYTNLLDSNLRGVFVELGVGGTVTNGATDNAGVTDPAKLVGQIIAERGNVTLAGLAVNQLGRVTATTTVNENGSIRLQARDGATVVASQVNFGNNGGQLQLGRRSVTDVALANSDEKAVDGARQLRSLVALSGKQIHVLEDAQVVARGGNINLSARAVPGPNARDEPNIRGTTDDGSRIYIAGGAVLDVSGVDVTRDMESNVIAAELRADELADSPLQRDSALRGETVYVDIRKGTPLADVSGYVDLIERDVSERNLAGGSITLESQGDVLVAQGATLDISGGSVTYRDGYINTSKLLGADGSVYDIAAASPDRVYTGLAAANSYQVTDARWGVTKTYLGTSSKGSFEQGYVEGKDAGSLTIQTPLTVFDGAIDAEVQTGRYQRQTSGTTPDQGYRPFDELPLGGSLVLGKSVSNASNDQITGDVLFGAGMVLNGLRSDAGNAFDPLRDDLPVSVNRTLLRSELFGDDGIATASVYSNSAIVLPETESLVLPGQGALTLQGAQIEVAGDIAAASGSISVKTVQTVANAGATSIDIAATSVLDVSGKWVNDSLLLNAGNVHPAALLIDGGSISLSADNGSLILNQGSMLDVSAGAWAKSDNDVIAGDAGAITLGAKADLALLAESVRLTQDATLLGYGFESGGALTIAAPEICIAADGVCGPAADGFLQLKASTLQDGGFGDITLVSNERGVLVKSGASVSLQQRNRVLDEGALNVATGATLDAISTLDTLPDHLRAASNLTLRAGIAPLADGTSYNDTAFAALPGLVIEAGAAIAADPGASISLQSNTRLVVDGAITAKGGDINLTLDSSLRIGDPIAAQGIWLGDNADLDVSGAARLTPDPSGLRIGEVLNGGNINIVAGRGSVVANPGATLDISGHSAILDIGSIVGPVRGTTPTLVSSDGGSLSVTAAETMLLSADINAHGGAGGNSAQGGRLTVVMDANDRGDFVLPVEQRRVVVVDDFAPISVAPGSVLPASYARQALVSADAIESAGFDSVNLVARTTITKDILQRPLIGPGAIDFSGNVSLDAGRQLILEAATITGNGAVSIAAPYVSIGHADANYQNTSVLQPTGGDTGFIAAADLIEVIGNSTVDGFADVTLASDGDIRLRGIQQTAATVVQGSLSTNADLTLRADQIYATTLSDFDIAVQDNPEGVLRIESTGQARDVVLSAGSKLALSAPTIEQAGVLRAPFGAIELNADTLTLVAGSLTSTSAENAVIPFGQTQAGNDWVYSLARQTLVVGDTADVPEQKVILNGDAVTIADGSVIDVSGGGELLAYEFVPGVGGSVDVLSAGVSSTRFAIVPALNLDYAPYDAQESSGSSLQVGDSIHISAGVMGLPEGDYVLLPARYALLDGAFVVEAVAGYTDLRPGEVLPQLNGSTIVSGYRRVANTSFADARTGGLLITPPAVLAGQAQYDTSLASEFFADQAVSTDTIAPRLMQDAGVLSIAAVSQLDISGDLRAIAQDGGRGAAVDISAENLVVSDAAVAAAGEVVVSAVDLSALGAESLLLGGSRSSSDDGVSIDVNATRVTIAGDAVLAAPELLVTATDTIEVQGGARLTAIGEVEGNTYLLEGDGAALRLAAGQQAEIRRDNETGATGSLILEQGAQLAADGGALAMDASLDVQSDALLALESGSLSLGASRINLATSGITAAGLTLDADQLGSLNLDQLALVSRSSIDIYGDVALAVNELSLDAAGLRSSENNGNASIAANSIVLGNRAGRTDAVATASGGTLQLVADEIVIAQGAQRISGYDDVALIAGTQIRGEDTGGLDVSGGLTLSTPGLIASTASVTDFTASGDLRVVTAGTVAQAQESALGGTLNLTGATVNVASRIEAGAGTVNMAAATGDVTIANGAVIDVSGRARDFDGTLVAADAGTVKLVSGQGDVLLQSGIFIDVSAAADGGAGRLEISAENGAVSLAGRIDAAAISAAHSGSVKVDVGTLGDFSALNAALNAGGFNAQRTLRQRDGDLTLAAGTVLTAQEVALTADAGSIAINGVINASGADGGEVVLSASDDVTVNGSIVAIAQSSDGAGGELNLLADAGGVRINTGASIDLSAGTGNDTDGGELNVRVTRTIAQTLTDGDTGNDALVLAGSMTGVTQTSLEAYQRYTDIGLGLTGGSIDNSVVAVGSAVYLEAEAFANTYGADIRSALGRSDDDSFRLLSGVEIQSDGDLILNNDWNLYNWQFGGAPGVLTLRADGSLTFNRSLSDGFNGVTGTTATAAAFILPATPRDSWSYRLIAGADDSSADLMAVRTGTDENFSIAAGTVPTSTTNPGTYRMVRTGNGYIDVAASGDFILGNQSSVLYTAGVASSEGFRVVGATTPVSANTASAANRYYPVDGGDISINVGGNIDGADTTQLYTDWLWRVGKAASINPDGFAIAWNINFSRFMQNVGALGGGNVEISAGGDISDLSVSIPSIGQQLGGVTAKDSVLNIIGGGDLSVYAGNDIHGGNYFVGLGDGNLKAGGDILSGTSTDIPLYPILGLGDGSWSVAAGGAAGIEAVLNPTLIPQARSQTGETRLSLFSTYADSSSLNLQSLTGDALLSSNLAGIRDKHSSINWGASEYSGAESLMLYAPGLGVSALSGDVLLLGNTTLFPAYGSSLSLYAENNISRADSAQTVLLTTPDVDPDFLPSLTTPQTPAGTDFFAAYSTALSGSGPNAHATTPVHAGDNAVAHLVARTGDIDFKQGLLASGNGDSSLLRFATPARIVAGGDVVDLPLVAQHDDGGDVSSIVAGGDLYNSVNRNAQGIILDSTREIAIDGPGTLLVTSGGDINLQTSSGILSRGNNVNQYLAEDGANIQLLAGLNGKAVDYAAFEQKYLADADTYATGLVAYVAGITGAEPADRDAALVTFAGLGEQQKTPFLQEILLAELRASAIEAASPDPKTNNDYTRGFTAVNTLFPDSGDYAGDIALYFSRVYTQDGGDILLLTPGGGVNAGLASPPSSFGITKAASQLGIVTQRGGDVGIFMDQDLQVNESRVFAINDSDIVVWSSNGDIDAGRGAKTAISASEPNLAFDSDGRVTATLSASLAGSGIQTRVVTDEFKAGDVVLAAPRGVVNAGDAGIVAGNLTIAATAVLGADNIKVSGVAVGVPVDAGGLGASLAGVSAAASSASNSATMAVGDEEGSEQQQAAPLAEEALSWLEVFVVGLGEEGCRQDDLECLKRQK